LIRAIMGRARRVRRWNSQYKNSHAAYTLGIWKLFY
jgi:hypothetical protein